MKLLTKEIAAKLPPLYSTEKIEDPLAIVKFFSIASNWTWYATEGQDTEDQGYKFFGLVVGHEIELGYFLLGELMSHWSIERDLYFEPQPLSKIIEKHEKERGQ
jgi:hypothetical protein